MSIIFDKRKHVVISERSIRCRRTHIRITNRIEFNADSVPNVVEHVTMESAQEYKALIAGAILAAAGVT